MLKEHSPFATNETHTYKDIYITSDEEIKEGDWVLYGEETVMQVKSSYDNDMSGEDIWLGDSLNGLATNKDNCKKIILTTDQDLIKDGVQAIDDEFLEWFVKNPSCEEVEVLTDAYTMQEIFELKLQNGVFKYKIITPQEEPKQETLKEVAENEASIFYEKGTIEWNKYRQVFELGAKCQAERMYSEEDMRKCWDASERFERPISEGYAPNFNEFIEQFKKK
jgi:hypothetical protein